MEDELILSERDKLRLDDIVRKMISNKEPDANIQFVVDDFKNQYGVKKKASGEPSEESASAPQYTLPKTLAETRPSVAPIEEVEQVDEFAKNVVDRKAEAKKANFETSGSINTRVRPTALPTGETKEEEDYFTGGFGQFLTAMKSPFNPVGSAIADFVDDMGRAVGAGMQTSATVSPSMELLEKGRKTSDEDINKYIEVAKSAQKIKPSDEMQSFTDIYEKEGKGIFGVLKGLANNPTVIPEVMVSSIAGMINPNSLASAGAVVGGATAVGAATTGPGALVAAAGSLPFAMGAATATMEAGLTFSELLNEELTKRGMDFTKDNVRTLLNDEKLVSNLRMRALGRGMTIGVVDGMTGQLAGSVGAKAATTTAGKAGRIAAAGGIEMAGGSAGEIAGRAVAGQEMDVAEIALEGISEAPGTVVDIASVVGSRPSYVVNGEKISETKMRDIMDNASPADLAGMDIKIKNDVNKYGEKITDAVETDAIAKEVKATVPNISEESVSRIVGLEKELKKLSTATTQTAKDRVSEIKSEIKSLREPAAQPEAEVALTTKEQQDAVQEQATDEGVLRAEEPQMGLQEVGQGDQEPQVAAQEGEAQEVAAGEGTVDNTIAADYLLTGGYNTVVSTDYLLKGIAGVFSRAGGAIDNIRNKYARELADKNLVDIKNFVGSDTYNSIVSEIREAINSAYGNNQDVQDILDEVLASPTGMPQRLGFSIESRLNDIDSRIGASQQTEPSTPTASSTETDAEVAGESKEFTIDSAFDEYGEPDYDAEEGVRKIASDRNLGITSDRELSVVARGADGSVIGGAFTSYDDNSGEYTFDVVVSEDAEGKGVGSKLLDAVKDLPGDLQDMNPDAKVKVDVVNPNMQKMLEKRGFVVTEKTGEDRVTMEPSSQVKEQKTAKLTTKKSPAPKVEKTQEELDLETQEQQLRALEDDIQIEQDNFVERKAEIAEQIKEAKAKKELSAPERRELIADLRAELDDAKNESSAIIGQYKEEAKALKKDVGKAKAKLQKKVQQTAPKAAAEPVAPAALTIEVPTVEAPTVQPFARPGVYSPAYIKTKLAEAYKKLPTKKFVELFNKHVDSGLTADIAKTSIGRDGYVNLFNSDDYVKFFNEAGIELAKEEAQEKKAEPRRTELEIARDAHERAKRDFLRKSGFASGAQLQALPEFIRLLRSYVRLGIATAKEAYARYKQEFPAVNISEDRFNSVFESAKRLEEKKKIREEASAESLAKRNAKMQERKARTEEAARKDKEDKAERDRLKQEEKEKKKIIDSAMDGYINAILESGNAKTIAAAFKNLEEVAGKLDKTEFVQQLRRTVAKLKENKHISTVSAGNLNRILRTIERVSPATYALEVGRAMNAIKKEINTQLRKQLNTNRKKALKNIQSGRIGNSTIKPLFQRVLSIDASMIPDESFDDYIAIVTRLGAKQAVLPLADRRAMEATLNSILDNVDAEAGRLIELGEMYNDFVSSNNLGEESYSKVLDKMKSEGLITEKEKEMMKRYKSIVLSEAKIASAGKRAENPETRAALEEELSNIDINVRALENRDDRAIATAIQDNLDAASEMTSQDIRKLLLVVDNINKGFLPHMGEVVRRKLVSINDGKKLASALNKVSLPLGEKIIVNVKGALMRLMGRKATETGTVRLAAERNPAAFIDEVFGNFKTTPIYDTLIRPMASAFSSFQRDFDVAVNKLNTAERGLYDSKKTDNEFRSSMYKIQMYLIQREYETNVGNPEVRPAVEWIKATIDAIKEGKLYNEATAAELREQLTKFSEDGQVSTEKIEKSLTPAEKNLIKAIDEVNNSIKDKAVHVSDVIRGEGIEARDNYVHIQVFNDGNNNPLKEIDAFTERYTASTKAKSLITRTGKVNPINLDPYQTAVRGLKMTLLDYHMTPAIKQVNGTLAASKDMVNQRQNLTAVESLMQGFNEGVLANAVGSSMSPDITDTLVTNGYRAVLASVRRAIAETASNITFAISNPAQFTAGVKSYYKLDSDVSFGDVMRNSNSVHTTRLAGGETLTDPQVEKSGFRNTGGVKTEMQPDVINKMARISKLWRRHTKNVGAIADFLMSTPDTMVSRPIWLGAYENTFKELTGKEPDLKKISDNDEAYMEANRDSIKKASKEADKQVTQAAASNSPYETIAKLRVNEKDTSSKKIYKAVNGFISRFAIFEYNTARRAIYAMIGNGSISRKEGAALLTGVAMRSIVYVMASSYIGGVMSALAQSLLAKLDIGGFDEEEEEEDLMDAILPNADTPFKFYRSLGGALANIFINRNFGNVVKNINGLLVETANEEYGQFLRNGENYDPYENNILMNQLSSLMSEGSSDEKIANFVAAFSGPLSPVARTFIRTFTLTNRAINNKTAASRKKNLDELTNRIPLELAGNLGLIPVYNDVRKVSMDILFDDVKKLEEVKSEAAKLQRQYPDGGDKYDKAIDALIDKYVARTLRKRQKREE